MPKVITIDDSENNKDDEDDDAADDINVPSYNRTEENPFTYQRNCIKAA